QGAVDLFLGMLADGASVEEDDVGVRGLVGQLIALPAQTADDQLAVEHVHLATDRLDVEFLAHIVSQPWRKNQRKSVRDLILRVAARGRQCRLRPATRARSLSKEYKASRARSGVGRSGKLLARGCCHEVRGPPTTTSRFSRGSQNRAVLRTAAKRKALSDGAEGELPVFEFLNPVYLFGLAAAAIPLIIHLSRSRRTKKMRFSTTRFFTDQFLRSYRMSRLKELLLLACRMLLFFLFAFALAQPLLRPKNVRAAGLEGDRTVVLVLDNSASMGYVEDGKPLLERAREAARDIVGGLRDGD